MPILFVLLAACAETAPPSAPPTPAVREAPEDADPLAVVPADADVVLYVDEAQLRDSPWTQDALAAMGAPLDGAVVDRSLRVRIPATGADASLVIEQGRFERDRVRAGWQAAHPGAAAGEFRGCAVWSAGGEALAFLTTRTVLRGPLPAVRTAIEVSLGRAPDVRRQRWLGELDAVLFEGRRGRRGPAVEVLVRLDEDMRARLLREFGEGRALERAGLRLDVGVGLDIAAVGFTRTAPQALDLSSRIEGELHDLRSRPSAVALGLGPLVERVRVTPRLTHVRAELHLARADRDQIAQRLAAVAQVIAKGAPASEP